MFAGFNDASGGITLTSIERHLACHAGYHKFCFRPIVGSGRTKIARGTTVMQAASVNDSAPSTRRATLQLALALGMSCLPPICLEETYASYH